MSYHALLRLLDSYSHAHDPMCSAAAAGGFIDKLVESKGLDFIDKEKAKRHAHENLYQSSGKYASSMFGDFS